VLEYFNANWSCPNSCTVPQPTMTKFPSLDNSHITECKIQKLLLLFSLYISKVWWDFGQVKSVNFLTDFSVYLQQCLLTSSHSLSENVNNINPKATLSMYKTKLTTNNFPVLGSLGHLISAAYLRKTHSPNHKHNQARNILHSLLSFILMPVAIPCTVCRKIIN